MPALDSSGGIPPREERLTDPTERRCAGVENTWSVVLAGGEGNRIRPAILNWLGEDRPKQYCTFVGTRSLLEHTLSRSGKIVPERRTLVVVDRSHERFAAPQLDNLPEVGRIVQPRNCDTAPGIFLPLTYVRKRDPLATVIFYPSDHFVYPEEGFVTAVHDAVREASCLSDFIILLGIEPDCLELDYGWIQPGPPIRKGSGLARSVRAFVEKPEYLDIRKAVVSGALWNTFVMVAGADCLWSLGWRFFPEMMRLFETLDLAIGSERETEVLDNIYSVMPSFNFSTALLQRVPERVGVLELRDVLWSDWGRPERVVTSLRKIDKQPSFRLRVARPADLRTEAPSASPLAVGETGGRRR